MLKRDPTVRNSVIHKGGKYIATVDLTLEVPSVYEDHGCMVLGDVVSIVGCFAMVVGNKYAVAHMPALIPISPNTITVKTVNDVKYHVFSFKKGSTVFNSDQVVRRAGIVYNLLNLFLFHSNQPWFMNAHDLFTLLNSTSKYADMDIDRKPETIELLIALAARVKGNISVLYKNGKSSDKLQWVSLADVKNLNSMFAKLTNNHQNTGMQSAINTEPNEPSAIERIVRA